MKLASLLPMYRWASPDEGERQAAVRNWKAAIQVAVEMGCDTMNSEFGRGPSPERAGHCSCCAGAITEACEAAWLRSMEELVPIFEKEGIQLNIEPHPEDFVETLQPAVDMIRMINSEERPLPLLRAPHLLFRRRHGRDDPRGRPGAGPRPRRRHLQPQGLLGPALHRQPAGLDRRAVHQHLDIGQGEVDWDVFFGTLAEVGFDGIMTACVFAWEERAEQTSRFMREEMQRYVDKYWK